MSESEWIVLNEDVGGAFDPENARQLAAVGGGVDAPARRPGVPLSPRYLRASGRAAL